MTGRAPAATGPAEHRYLDRLQTRLAVVLFAVLAPVVLWTVAQSVLAWRAYNANLAEGIRSVATLVSRYETDFLAEVETTLRSLAANPAVMAARDPECTELLVAETERSVRFITFSRLSADGVSLCSSSSATLGVAYADRPWFQRLATGTEDFVVSELLVGRVNPQPRIALAVPVATPAGGFGGALAVGVDAQSIATPRTGTGLPPNVTLIVVDHEGQPVASSSQVMAEHGGAVPEPAVLLQHIASGAEVFVAEGQDGVRRLYATADVARDQLNVIIGLPVGGRFAWLRPEFVAGVLGPATMVLLGLVAVWIAAHRLVVRHVTELASSARLWGRGQLDVRPDLTSAPVELRELGAVFGRMASRIAEREAELSASLAQKELLLKEVHHRVKNNLQIVASLLSLRSQAMRNPEVQEALAEVQTRIKALALVHRKLYEHDEPTTIDLAEFLAELASLLSVGVGPESGVVEIRTDLAPVRVAAEQAVPVALLVTEIMTNSLKHAFPAERAGSISLHLRADGETVSLTIGDDGVGRSPFEPVDGLGLRLCRMVARQIGGTLELSGPPGMVARLVFPLRRSVAGTAPGAAGGDRAVAPAPAEEFFAGAAEPGR